MDRDCLSVLRPGDGAATAVFVHASGGSGGGFRRIAPLLPAGLGVLAFEVYEPGPPQRCGIAPIAEEYLTELRRGATGRVTLVGWSFGGSVAVQMAATAPPDVDVAGVVLVDSATPAVLAPLRRAGVAEIESLFGLAGRLDPDLTESAALAEVADLLGPGTSVTDLRVYLDVHRWHLRALRTPWAPGPAPVPITLVRARDEPGWHGTVTDLGWSDLLGHPVRIEWIPGGHDTVFDRPSVHALADLITNLIDRTTPTAPVRD